MLPTHTLFFLFLLQILHPTAPTSTSFIGVNYGLVADNLPNPSTVPSLLSSISIGRVKLYNPDPAVLRAFSNTGIEFIVGVPDQCLSSAASDPSFSSLWVQSNIRPFLPRTKIVAITVGNEILTNSNDTSLAKFLLPAMENIHSALVSLNLDKQVMVTTTHSVAVLESSYPPSSGRFKKTLLPYICPILNFHSKTGSPFLINAYPFFAYKSDPKQVPLNYVLFEPNDGVQDGNLKYDNMLYAQIDAIYAAIKAANGGGGGNIEVRVSETGWPSAGDEDEDGATPGNAAKYNGNLMRLVMGKKGTPMRPDVAVRVYVFALFNENLKAGPGSERNYGLFKPDGTPAYDLGIDFPKENSTSGGSSDGGGGGGSGGGGDGGGGGVEISPPSPDYFDVSSVEWMRKQRWFGAWATLTVVGSVLLFV